MLNGGSTVWGFCVYFVYMIPLETDVLRKHRFQKMRVPLPWDSNALFLTIILHFLVFLELWQGSHVGGGGGHSSSNAGLKFEKKNARKQLSPHPRKNWA